MGWGVWASQPTTVTVGTIGASTSVTFNTHTTELSFSESSDVFGLLTNNQKFERDGGVISTTKEFTLTIFDMRQLDQSYFLNGKLWQGLTVTYYSEGPSSDSGSYGSLQVKCTDARVTGISDTDQGGRKALQATFRAFSRDGTTDPFSYNIV